MRILNPLYDPSFKYLFQDPESARLLLEVITGFKILNLTTMGQEFYRFDEETEEDETTSAEDSETAKKSDRAADTLKQRRLDFVCRIEDELGVERVCLVEIQNSYANSEITRFRRYIAYNYNSLYHQKEGVPLELLGLYFLGRNDPDLGAFRLVKVARKYVDQTTGREISNATSKFAERLTHEIYLVNITALKNAKDTLPEKVLQIFDQSKRDPQDPTVLEIDPKDYPPKFQRLLEYLRVDGQRRNPAIDLIRAEAEREAELLARAEQSIILERENQKAEARLARAKQEEKEARRKEEEARRAESEAKRKEQEAKRKEEGAKRKAKKAMQQAEKAEQKLMASEAEKQKQRIEVLRLALQSLIKAGLPISQAAANLNITEAEARKILSEDS